MAVPNTLISSLELTKFYFNVSWFISVYFFKFIPQPDYIYNIHLPFTHFPDNH